MTIYSKEKFSMRMITEDDLTMLAKHRNSEAVWSNLTSPIPVVEGKQLDWLNSLYKTDFYFIARRQDSDIGLLRATDIDWVNRTACVGLDIFEQYRGRGFAQGAFELVVDYCFQVLNLHRAWLLVLETNLKAIHVYKKSGFEVEGVMRQHIYRNGKYLDYVLMGKINDSPV